MIAIFWEPELTIRSISSLSLIAGACLLALTSQATANVLTDAISTMAVNSWQKINLNAFSSVLTPSAQRPTIDSPSSNISGFSGAAWDSTRGNLLIWGGDIGNEQGNEVYVFNSGSGLWSRGSLPSQITSTNGIAHTVDGIANAPLSGESWDNVVYLGNVDRMAVMGVSRNGSSWLNPSTGLTTGPYFWDPAKADANKVSGLTGSQVNPAANPSVVGGEMWQNRGNATAFNGTSTGRNAGGTTAYTTINGKDVVYITDQFDNLWRYTVNDLNPANDSWVQIGRRTITGQSGWGSGALDESRNIYLKSLTTNSFGFWDIDRPGGSSVNREIQITPVLQAGVTAPDFRNFGIQFDPVLDAFVMWDGSSFVWRLTPPDNLDPNNDGILDVGTGWTLDRITVAGSGPTIPTDYTGVYGKWIYLEDQGAYISVIDPVAGDVFLYKSASVVPEPATVLMMLAGMAGIATARRKAHSAAAA